MTAAERAFDTFMVGWRAGWKRDPTMTLSEWADTHRVLQPESSSEPGQWRTERTPYLREIMDCLSADHPCHKLVFMKSAQIGGTEVGLNWLGYIVHNSPGPTLIVYPTVEVAEDVSKDRISPMIRTTPVVAERVFENKSRRAENTILNKYFRGGLFKLTGSNSAAGLRSKPMKNLFFDEADGYTDNADGEGDPVALAVVRSTNFAGKIFMPSTPGEKGGRIEREFLKGDQRRYFVPCPHCGHMDHLQWVNLRWEDHDPSTAQMVCMGCGCFIEEHHKTAMLAGGEWRPTAESPEGVRSYHINGLYSPLGWLSWATMAEEWLAAQKDPTLIRAFVNTRLGESYEDRNISVEPDLVLAHREHYPAEVPNGVGILVASVDTQGTWLAWKVKGYGAGEESWLIAWGILEGDPAQDQVWRDLDDVLKQRFTHESGQTLRIECVVVDSGGNHTDQVYKYTRLRASQRYYAIRGGNEVGQPLVGKPTSRNRFRARVYTLCVDTGKETVYSRLRIGKPLPGVRSPGYMHMPDTITQEYAEQLVSEKAFRKVIKGRPGKREWKQVRERNEALDLEVYCLAALRIRGQAVIKSLAERAARFARPTLGLPDGSTIPPPSPRTPVAEDPLKPARVPPPVRPPRRGNWVTRGLKWR